MNNQTMRVFSRKTLLLSKGTRAEHTLSEIVCQKRLPNIETQSNDILKSF